MRSPLYWSCSAKPNITIGPSRPTGLIASWRKESIFAESMTRPLFQASAPNVSCDDPAAVQRFSARLESPSPAQDVRGLCRRGHLPSADYAGSGRLGLFSRGDRLRGFSPWKIALDIILVCSGD